MIKFFRKIRQNLLTENKTGKYLKYAIGEIILVVIGILIALQINNWNEHRKFKLNDLRLCKELLNDALADSVFYESRLTGLNRLKSTVNYILKKPELRKPDSVILEVVDKGDNFFYHTGFRYLSNVVYNSKNSLQILQSKSVINTLRRYFLQYDYVAASFERLNRINEMELYPLKKKHMNLFIALDKTQDLSILNTIYDDEAVQKSIFIIDGNINTAMDQLLLFQENNRELIKVLKGRINNGL